MRLIFYRGTTPNFGDDLNEFLWPALAPGLFDGDQDRGFLGIGTIIGMDLPPVSQVHVFSSGVGYRELSPAAIPHKFWCLRGPLSAQALGLDHDVGLTDGAILSPLVFGKEQAGSEIGVVPHWESLLRGGWEETCAQAGFKLIDPMRTPQEVIADIQRKRLILAESLHGAILADAYGIPWIPFSTSGNFSLFKWMDWTSSVEVPLLLSAVPPPTANAVLRFGKPNFASEGQLYRPTVDDAMAEFQRKTEEIHELRAKKQAALAGKPISPGLTQVLKDKVKTNPIFHRLMGYSASRTAEALVKLSKLPPSLSDEARRDELRERMLEKFRNLEKENRPAA